MDYKRKLGHRVLPRHAFLDTLKKHRGPYRFSSCGELEPGTRVTLHDIVSKPELNGATGIVTSSPAPTGRVCVEIDGGIGAFHFSIKNIDQVDFKDLGFSELTENEEIGLSEILSKGVTKKD